MTSLRGPIAMLPHLNRALSIPVFVGGRTFQLFNVHPRARRSCSCRASSPKTPRPAASRPSGLAITTVAPKLSSSTASAVPPHRSRSIIPQHRPSQPPASRTKPPPWNHFPPWSAATKACPRLPVPSVVRRRPNPRNRPAIADAPAFPGFIALVVFLSLIIVGSCVAVFFLLRTHAPSSDSQHWRPAHGRSESSAPFASHMRMGSADTVSSLGGVKEKLAGMFQATLTFGRTRGARAPSQPGGGGWTQAAHDEWDSGDDEEAELGMRAAPHHTAVVTPGHSQHTSHHAPGPYDPHHPPAADPYAPGAGSFVVVQGYRPMANGLMQPGRGQHQPPATPARQDSDDSALSETPTVVPDAPPPPPRALVEAALARAARDRDAGGARPPLGLHRSTSSGASVPASFHSARTHMSPFGEGGEGSSEPPFVASPPQSPTRTFGGGTRFQEGL